MRKVMLVCDLVADLKEDYCKSEKIAVLPMSYNLDGVEYDDINTPHMPGEELYAKMREGAMPKTSQVNAEVAKEYFVKFINDGYDVFYVTCSSGISGTINSAILAKRDVEENKKELINKDNQDFKIVIIDSKSASLGYGMLVSTVNEYVKEGKSLEELEEITKKLIPNVIHYFTVDDLNHLARGGRISKSKAFIGGLLNIKPILNVNDDGQLKSIGKEKGRKKAILSLVDYMEKKLDRDATKKVYISHGDCIKDVEFLQKKINERFGEFEYIVNLIGPIVGTHSGPGTLALFFFGTERFEEEI